MDVVVYSENDVETKKLGAVQDDGRVTPLCVWSLEPAFEDALEFLVDEDDFLPGFVDDTDITIHSIVPEHSMSYGSRQVGGGMGPGNPHGEESELLYYIENEIVASNDVEVIVKPELEIFW